MKQEKHVLKGVKVIDLFSGIGGFHYALTSFGADVIYACEWDKEAASVYEKNFGLTPVGDITQVDEKSVPNHNIMCAGFPCQAFSISGKRLGFEDSRGTLFFDVARIVKEKQPEIVFLENVKNLVSHDEGRTFIVICNIMKELGYTVYSKVLDSSKFGSAQKRERIYIICFRNDIGVDDFSFPVPRNGGPYVKDILLPECYETDACLINRKDVIMNGREQKPSDSPLRIGIVNKGGQGERIYSIEGKAITLSAYGGGVGSRTGIYLVNGKLRKLAPRECARLDGFPDTFIMAENKYSAYKQFGNSVVIDVLQEIVEQIVKCKSVQRWLHQVQK